MWMRMSVLLPRRHHTQDNDDADAFLKPVATQNPMFPTTTECQIKAVQIKAEFADEYGPIVLLTMRLRYASL